MISRRTLRAARRSLRLRLGSVSVPGPLLGVGRLRDGGRERSRGRGRRTGGAVVLDGLGLRVPEVEVTRGAVDEAPPRLGQRRIWRRVAGARRRRHSSQPDGRNPRDRRRGLAGGRGLLRRRRRRRGGEEDGGRVALFPLCSSFGTEPFLVGWRRPPLPWLSRSGD